MVSNAPHQLQAVDFGHHPVGDHQRKGFRIEEPPGFAAGCRRCYLVAPSFQMPLEQPPRNGVVFGDQHFHDRSPWLRKPVRRSFKRSMVVSNSLKVSSSRGSRPSRASTSSCRAAW